MLQKSLAEGFGLTVAEAMWKRRPVVASRIGGIRDQIDDGTSGVLLSDPRDLSEAGNAIAGLLAAPERSRQLGEAAHERVQHHFLGPHHLGRYFEVIQRLIAQRPLPEHLREPVDGGRRDPCAAVAPSAPPAPRRPTRTAGSTTRQPSPGTRPVCKPRTCRGLPAANGHGISTMHHFPNLDDAPLSGAHQADTRRPASAEWRGFVGSVQSRAVGGV